MKVSKKFMWLILLAAFIISSANLFAQDSNDKKVLTLEGYARWRSITSTSISYDGNWITFGYWTPQAEDTLYVKNLTTDKEIEIPRGSRPQFSNNSKWVAYVVSLPRKEAQKLRKDNKTVPIKAQLMNLETGEKLTWDNVTSFSFSNGSKLFAVKKPKSDRDAKHNGTDLILRNLEKGVNEHIGSVSSFSFNKPGTLLAYTIDAADKTGNGLYVINLDSGSRRTLDYGDVDYSRMTWDEEGEALAVLKGKEKKDFIQKENSLVIITDLGIGEAKKFEYNPADSYDFPKNMVISEKRALSWSKDLTKVFFGVKEQEAIQEKKSEDAEEVANVDIWHWQDTRIQSVQMVRANSDRNFTYRGVFNLENKRFVQLTDESMREINITQDGKWGIGQYVREYISDWKERKADYYRVNIATGERTLMFKAHGRTLGLSPDSKHFLYWKEGHVWDYKIETGEKINLTKNAPVSFVNKEYDYPGEVPAYGLTGWIKDSTAVILTHRYDLWLQPLDGSIATNLTGGIGEKEEIRFRYVRLDQEERFIDLSEPVLLSAYGQWTKKAGYYRLDKGELEKLIYVDKRVGRPVKSKNADKLMYNIESFVDFPNYYVSDTKFSFPKRVTDANPWQSEYKWGHRILFDYTNKNGIRLQGTLAIPDDYQPDQKLPMMVNFYEKNSQNLHRYVAPRYASSFGGVLMEPVSKGYLVMQADIHFNKGSTHADMLDCVEAAVKKVIEMGYADANRIGLNGHSFSGQGASYIATQSKMFAAIASGAGVTNLVSEFNHFWGWNYQVTNSFGGNGQRYSYYGQGRLGTNPHDDFELYWNESAVAHVKTMDTPLLLFNGTSDGTVAIMQNLEFYNALRFNRKNVILLAYPGEGHSLSNLANRKDLTVRMQQFFDHYLMDKPAPDWMVNGVPYLKKEK